ncbi:tol-pal system YbgF family protein [Streptomyces californicus]|uniref:tetratricopeptide repeat protein n=1 Tax=Streptomyces californicus TaxID=67351 RepID=UPI00371A22A2
MSTHPDAAYAGLGPDTARTYRDLSRLPVHDIDTSLVAAVRRLPPEDAAGHLTTLACAALLEKVGSHDLRGPLYRFPSRVARERAGELARVHESQDEGHDVLGRALGWALDAATAADAQATDSHYRALNINPGELPHRPQHPMRHEGPEAAVLWLTAQSENLLALVRAAYQNQMHAYVWRLVHSMWPWWRAAGQGHSTDWIELHALALVCLDHDDSAGEREERHLLNTYGIGLRLDGSPIALRTFTRVREMAGRAGDALGGAHAFYELGATHLQRGDVAEAVPFLQLARRIWAEHGSTRGVAVADILLGQAALRMPSVDTTRVLRRFGDARAALEGVDGHDAARALAWRGRAQLQAGDFQAGESDVLTAVQEFLDGHAPREAARALEWLGNAAEDGGRPAEARACYSRALSLYPPVSGADADRVRARIARLT